MDALLSLVLLILIVGLICWVLTIIIDNIPGLAPFNQIARAIVLVVGLVVVLKACWPFLTGLI